MSIEVEGSTTFMRASASKRGRLLAILGLWLLGCVHWAWFLSPAHALLQGPSFTIEDWRKEHRYATILKQAVTEGIVPYTISRPIHTRRFLALPEVTWSPQIVLLRWTSVGTFVVMNTLFLFSLGAVGLSLLARRLSLGFTATSLLFMVFAFGGHISSHLAVGHSMWAAYFLYPFVLSGLLDVLEGRRVWRLALPLFLLAMNGGFHLFVFAVFLVTLVALFERSRLAPLVGSIFWAMLLSACRFAPAYFLLDRKEQAFLSGFPSPGTLVDGLVSIREASEPRLGGLFGSLSWWEYDFYLGYAGLIWLVGWGLVRPLLRRGGSPILPPALGAAAVVLAVLSMGDVWAPFGALPVPLVSAERVSSRFLILPLLVLACLAAGSMEEWLREGSGRRRRVVAAAITVALGLSLFAHSRAWRVERLEGLLPQRTGRLEIAISPPAHPPSPADAAYRTTVHVSGLVSLAALLALGGLGLWPRRSETEEISARPGSSPERFRV